MKNFKYIAYGLAFVAFIFSVSYLYSSYTSTPTEPENFLDNIVMVFSNVMLILVFLFLGKSAVINNSTKMKAMKVAKWITFVLLVYVVFSFSVFMNFTLNYGFFEGRNLFYQIVSLVLSLSLISYFIYRIQEINKKLNIVV